jgi:uncharacterized membrane protein YgcG
LCQALLVCVSVHAKRLRGRTAQLFRLGSFARIAIQFRQRQAGFGCVAFISKFLFDRKGLTISLLRLLCFPLLRSAFGASFSNAIASSATTPGSSSGTGGGGFSGGGGGGGGGGGW